MNASYESLYRHRDADANDIPFLSVSDTAEYLGVSKSKIYKDIRDGKLLANQGLDDTTMLSPRALQHAYPELDIAEIFELEPIDIEPENGGGKTQNTLRDPHDLTTLSDKNITTANKNTPSIFELALDKNSATGETDNDIEKAPIAEPQSTPEVNNHPTEDTQSEGSAQRKMRTFEIFAALSVASAILLIVIMKI